MKLWRGQPDHDNWRLPFSSREKAGMYLGISAMLLVLTLSELYTPSVPPFAGRYSWLHSTFYQLNSDFGIIGFYSLIALIIFIVGTLKWFEK
jgi:hypothetical protein